MYTEPLADIECDQHYSVKEKSRSTNDYGTGWKPSPPIRNRAVSEHYVIEHDTDYTSLSSLRLW